MTKSSLKARLARLGPTRAVDRNPSGSPAELRLEIASPSLVNPIAASHALAFCGLSLLRAKRAVEALLEAGSCTLRVPNLSDLAALTAQLSESGVTVTLREDKAPDIAALRARLGMTQEQFALLYGLELRTLQSWERKRPMDRAVASYLRMIETFPEEMSRLARQAL